MGFYQLDPIMQLDLMAYYRVVQDSNLTFKYNSVKPMSLNDRSAFELLLRGKVNPTRPEVDPIARRSLIKHTQADPGAVDWWMSND